MRSSSSLVFILAALGAAAGCSDPVSGDNPPVDSGNPVTDRGTVADNGSATTDTGPAVDSGTVTPMDSGTVTPTDGGTSTDRPVVDAGPPVDPCVAASVVDLNMAGMRTGTTTRITRSNATTPRNGTLRASCQANTVGQIVFRYTPTAAGRLAISTDNAGTTPANFDTVAWVQATCAAPVGDAGATSLGCDDDSGGSPRDLSSRFVTAAAVAAGTPVFIIVAGYGSATASTGSFELSVTEVSTVTVGGMCDPAGVTSVCAMGSVCYAATSGATTGTCVADGALNGACRMTGTACDGAFVCSGAQTSPASRCRTAVAVGAACDPLRVMNVCTTGSNCITRMGASTCVAAGGVGGACRTTEPRCDGMLSCSSAGICRTIVAVGGACETSNATTVCATGGTCVATASGAAMGTCRAAGSAPGTACRTTEPRCDGMLSCSSLSVCRTVVAAGGACETSNATTVCDMGGSCVAATAGAVMGTCRAAGTAAGTACREAAPRCDTGLDCSTMTGTGVCRRSVAAGGACAAGALSDLCAMGTACLPTSATAATCSMANTPETEPNNTPAMAQAPITASRIYSGTASETDVDCFGVTVPMGAGLFVESNLPATPACATGGPDPVIEVYSPAGMEIASVDDTSGRGLCGTLTPAGTAALRNLTAGNYTVCVAGFNTMMVNYLLTIGIIPPG